MSKKESTYKVKMAGRGYTRQEILNKIEEFTEKYELAKRIKDSTGCHSYRNSRAYWRNRLSQFDENPELYAKKPKKSAPNSAEEMREAKRLFINAKRNYLIDPSEENYREYTFLGSRYETMKKQNREWRQKKCI